VVWACSIGCNPPVQLCPLFQFRYYFIGIRSTAAAANATNALAEADNRLKVVDATATTNTPGNYKYLHQFQMKGTSSKPHRIKELYYNNIDKKLNWCSNDGT
ncbi:hypothetical protein Tco_0350795, partial [Tanacetum coccineum]